MKNRARKKYSTEFKREAVSLVIDQGYSKAEAGRSLDVNPNLIRRWQREFSDLEDGNTDKGLIGSLGEGEGRWRLTVSSDEPVKVMSLIRTPDGFLTNLSRVTPVSGHINEVFIMNPGSNINQRSSLRIINDSDDQGSITVTAYDDSGETAPGGMVTFDISVGAAMELSAAELENGGGVLVGALGDGNGKWHVKVESNVDLKVQSLLDTPGGFLTNLSSSVE